jgi:hypothetical protein
MGVARVAVGDDKVDKRVCLSSYVDAQARRQEGKLRASLQALARCGREQCPVVIRNDCVRWQREVDQVMPTVVLSAVGADGRDRPDASASLDGEPLAARLDGRPVAVDPGPHEFAFGLEGQGTLRVSVVVREGEKDRSVVGTFPRVGSAPGAPAPALASARPIPTSVWVLGSAGVASMLVSASFAGLGWFGSPGWVSSQACRPGCSPGDVSVIKERFMVADVAGAVAVASLGAAAYLFFARKERATPIALTVGPRDAGLQYGVRF